VIPRVKELSPHLQFDGVPHRDEELFQTEIPIVDAWTVEHGPAAVSKVSRRRYGEARGVEPDKPILPNVAGQPVIPTATHAAWQGRVQVGRWAARWRTSQFPSGSNHQPQDPSLAKHPFRIAVRQASEQNVALGHTLSRLTSRFAYTPIFDALQSFENSIRGSGTGDTFGLPVQ
jgi:hypothetical protein